MIYLVDANVLSEPTKQAADSRVVTWLSANESNVIVDSIIIGELRDYVLEVTVTDVFNHTSASQRTRITVD